MKLRKIERDGEITQMRVMLNERLTKRVEEYLRYYEQLYGTTIDMREFGLLAVEAILESDTEFKAWSKKQETQVETKAARPAKTKAPVANGQVEVEVRE
jgi:hypothetical protein